MSESGNVSFEYTREEIFPQGSKYTDTFQTSLESIKNNLESIQTELTSVFVGDIATSADEGFETLKGMIDDICGDLTNLAQYLRDYLEDSQKANDNSENVFLTTTDGYINLKTTTIPDNLTVDEASGWVFPVEEGKGHLENYSQFSANGDGVVHRGADIYGAAGTPIYAATDGEIEYVGWDKWGSANGGYGYCVVIKSQDSAGNVVHIINGHMQQNSSSYTVGQKVSAGEQIGSMGNTGNCPQGQVHLHFEVRSDLSWQETGGKGYSLSLGSYYGQQTRSKFPDIYG